MSEREELDLDRALARLGSDSSLADRKDVLTSLVKYWHGEIRPSDGLSDAELAGVQVPETLRWWYCWAGRRTEVLGKNNDLLSPKHLSSKDGLLVFYGENQWVYEWATDPTGEDPPVHGRFRGETKWQAQEMRLSEHLILACLFEGIMCHSTYSASAAWLPEKELFWIINRIPPVSINPWKWNTARFYAHRGAFMMSMENGIIDGTMGYSIWVGAKKKSPLEFLHEIIDYGWEQVDL